MILSNFSTVHLLALKRRKNIFFIQNLKITKKRHKIIINKKLAQTALFTFCIKTYNKRIDFSWKIPKYQILRKKTKKSKWLIHIFALTYLNTSDVGDCFKFDLVSYEPNSNLDRDMFFDKFCSKYIEDEIPNCNRLWIVSFKIELFILSICHLRDGNSYW